MYAAKHAHQILEKIPDSNVYVFYMDVRTPGKGYEEFYDRTRKDGANYIRGRVAKIYKEGGRLICRGEDSLLGRQVTVEADLVILETAMVPADGIGEVVHKTWNRYGRGRWGTGSPSETAAGGDADCRSISGRYLSGTKGYSGYSSSGIRRGSKSMRTVQQIGNGDFSHDQQSGSEQMLRLRALRSVLPVQSHYTCGN